MDTLNFFVRNYLSYECDGHVVGVGYNLQAPNLWLSTIAYS